MSRDMRPVAGLLLGAILGGALVQAHTYQVRNALLAQSRLSQLDARHWRQESLRLRDQIAEINRKREKKTFVQSVNLEVMKSPVPLIDVEAALEPYTESLLGIPLSDVKLSMVYQLYQGRRLVLGEHIYRVEVKALLVSPEVVVLLHLTPLGRTSRG
ncbi:hypothetical protein [Sulfobacillus harzensis]|uniref:Uncharacterized protein n=1 Tax=Sulfobacillus harzensis TaxID=2729629 RepID=A0A7Y0L210_9FIRM|nr:hypothetical protein [Sulfobacillus harzensis]NMP21852.1 hypothetical protein [Sulfobacillus harzensis]